MGHVYFRHWCHLIWSTKNRHPYFGTELQEKIHSHIFIISKKKGFSVKAVNGYTDHIHMLINVDPKDSISGIVQLIKGESSHWINSERMVVGRFAWQESYALFSVSESLYDKTLLYMNNQKEHHRRITFEEEFNNILELHKLQIIAE